MESVDAPELRATKEQNKLGGCCSTYQLLQLLPLACSLRVLVFSSLSFPWRAELLPPDPRHLLELGGACLTWRVGG